MKQKNKLQTNPDTNEPNLTRLWIWIFLFSVAFAWVESAVVIYLREIFFDGGFSFPLKVVWEEEKRVVDPLVYVELGREAATMLMLAAAGAISGKNGIQKFCFFIISFGLWDIFYYIWLFVLRGWPESLMTWDLLFFIPLPWVGPVITPVLIALAMVVGGSLLLYLNHIGYSLAWRWYDIAIEVGCALLMITAFCWDWKNILQLPGNPQHTGIPKPFAWWIYLPAYCLSLIYFAVIVFKTVSTKKTAKTN